MLKIATGRQSNLQFFFGGWIKIEAALSKETFSI
jgi:hypothetical protein